MILSAVALLIPVTAARAQSNAPETTPPPAVGAQNPGPQNRDVEWLAHLSKLYFSSAKENLAGFNCDIRPDWHALLLSASKTGEVPENDPYLAQLKKVKVKMHGRMQGGSTVEWLAESSEAQPAPSDTDATVETLHQTVQQVLEGFMQFWSPFMEVTLVPKQTDGVEITHETGSHTIHAKQGAAELTEIFNNDLVLEHFNVTLAGTSIKLAPTFESTPQGLLVRTFSAEILPAGAPPEQTQKMRARVNYQTVNNRTIPGQLTMDIGGAGSFNFAFEGCSTEAN